MIYTKEFNRFFESFDTGNISPEELEKLKIDMYSGWEGRQFEIHKLKARISELEEILQVYNDEIDRYNEFAEERGD